MVSFLQAVTFACGLLIAVAHVLNKTRRTDLGLDLRATNCPHPYSACTYSGTKSSGSARSQSFDQGSFAP